MEVPSKGGDTQGVELPQSKHSVDPGPLDDCCDGGGTESSVVDTLGACVEPNCSVPLVAAAAAQGHRRWIMDTGSGHDIVNLPSLPHQIRKTVAYRGFSEDFDTADGRVAADQHVSLRIPALSTALDQVAGIQCLKDFPNILSVGWRCQEEGFAFYWPPGAYHAFLIPPEAKKPIVAKGSQKKWVKCPADRWIPYLQDDYNPVLLHPDATPFH